MLVPAFTFKLPSQISSKLLTIGKYDGKHSSLTCGTNGGKVLIHNPHEHSPEDNQQLKTLNINKQITALCAGELHPDKKYDVVLVGTQTNLFAYDVEQNADVFYKDVPDGINALIFGHVQDIPEPLAIVGGNCSIQGFNHEVSGSK